MGCGGYVGHCGDDMVSMSSSTNGCGSPHVSGCGGASSNYEEVEQRREFGGCGGVSSSYEAVEQRREFGGCGSGLEHTRNSGYKIVREVNTCHGKEYEEYEIDERLARALIELTTKSRENSGPSVRRGR